MSENDGEVRVGSESAGYRLTTETLVFGGPTITATDIAVATRRADIGDRALTRRLSKETVRRGMERM